MDPLKELEVLFDGNGRRRPHIPKKLKSNICDADGDFRLDQPKLEQDIDYANRVTILHESLGIDTGITGKQLRQEEQRLRKMIADMSQVANILKGVCLPVVLTKRHNDDIGEDLEWQMEGVNRSYAKIFPDRRFYNYREGTLAGQVKIIKKSRYQAVWDRRASEHIITLFFPNPLQGFSINAQREQMASLAKFRFVLSGAVESMAMYSDVLASGRNRPGLELAALSWRSADYSLHFEASDDKLDFLAAGYLASAYDSFSGGLLFLG
jgi:hypothetical protein